MEKARQRQAELAKPPGSLGKLEDYSIRLAGITGNVKNEIEKCRVIVLAADNGVTAEGVSSAPTSVTLSQVINMTRHITGMSSLAFYFGNEVVVADLGIDTDRKIPGVLDRKIRRSTGNIAKERAMTRQQVLDAMAVGLDLAADAAKGRRERRGRWGNGHWQHHDLRRRAVGSHRSHAGVRYRPGRRAYGPGLCRKKAGHYPSPGPSPSGPGGRGGRAVRRGRAGPGRHDRACFWLRLAAHPSGGGRLHFHRGRSVCLAA